MKPKLLYAIERYGQEYITLIILSGLIAKDELT